MDLENRGKLMGGQNPDQLEEGQNPQNIGNSVNKMANAQDALMRMGAPKMTDEEAQAMQLQFEDKFIRRGFMRKVYSILTVQLLLTVGVIATFMFGVPALPQYKYKYNASEAKMDFVSTHMWLLWTSMAVTFVTIFPMVCSRRLRRLVPINFLILTVFTAGESVMLGMVCLVYDVEAVLMAAGITLAIVIFLTIFAFQTKIDFTAMRGFLLMGLILLMAAGFLMIFLPYNRYAEIGYGCAGAFIFSGYLLYDTQVMMGGNHKFSISPEEYVFAALALYLDIINIFLYILRIIGAAKK